jgi:hypothetical protein
MDTLNIDGIKLTSLKKIYQPKGNILHCMKKSDLGFKNFGEKTYKNDFKFNCTDRGNKICYLR